MATNIPLHLALLSLFTASSLFAQDIQGTWYTEIDAYGIPYRMALHIEIRDSTTATLDILEPNEFRDIPVPNFSIKSGRVSFSLEMVGHFEGHYFGQEQIIIGHISHPFIVNQVIQFLREPFPALQFSGKLLKNRVKKQEVYIPMRDGTHLFTAIYTPIDTSRSYPILIQRTPYRAESSEEAYQSFEWDTLLLNSGYIFVIQDVRGRYMSEGVFEDVRPYNPHKTGQETDENSDTYDTIDWLVKNLKHNNGRVGIYGISYPGFYSTMSLMEAHPALKAVSPQAPISDWFVGDDWHHNGAFFLMDAFSFYSFHIRPQDKPSRQQEVQFSWPNQDNYSFFLNTGTIKELSKKYFGDTIPYWSNLMEHPNYDAFWKSRTPLPHLKNIQPAVLTVGGWFDAEDLYGPLATYQAIEKNNPAETSNRLIMGPWFHGQWSWPDGSRLGNLHWGSNTSAHFKKMELGFFDHYLKKEGDFDLPEASIFITGQNNWESFNAWPPENTEPRQLYFHENGKLEFSSPDEENSFDEYFADPDHPVPYTEDVHQARTIEYMVDDQRFSSRRPDVMTYQSEWLSEEITLVGPLEVDLWVSTTGTDADYVVKLIDVFPEDLQTYPDNEKNVPMAGYQMLVRGDVLRGRYRNSLEKPKPMVPEEVTRIRFTLPDIAHTFLPGHRIMVQVQHSWFPLVDRNPQKYVNIYECSPEDYQVAKHRIYHDAERPSRITVKKLNY